MVSYQKWTSIVFQVHPEADATDVISVAASEWRTRKEALRCATVQEAREHAKSL